MIEIFDFKSDILNETRKIRVYTPNKMDKNYKYPVLYMHDAQNIFPSIDNYTGLSWEVDSNIEKLILENKTKGIIVVGVDCTKNRLDDYSPWEADNKLAKYFPHMEKIYGGNGDKYSDFLVLELKKYIDIKYNTNASRETTFIAGSSMGGFISTYISVKYQDVFSKIGVFSIASWFNLVEFNRFLDQVKFNSYPKYFINCGDDEKSKDIPDLDKVYIMCSTDLNDRLIGLGVSDIKFYISKGHKHEEKSWAKVVPDFLEWLIK